MTDLRTLANEIFYQVGGTAWYEKMLMGSVVVIVGLLLIIAVITVYLAFKGRP